ncbi:hypothetical protein IJH10_00140 [Candidatus Saccharibacteria bacterium]|nr:hypothetical protein [Candidatus Saccharibacteria bacterium]MBR0415616.1 hypothetical protein [Candidatus Saccharibacteria bacterium]
MKKTKMLSMVIAAFFVSVFVGVIAKQPAHAEMAEVAQKWIFSQYYHCLQGGELNKQFDRKNHTSGEVADTIFPKGGSSSLDYSRLPSEGYFTSVGETSINCYQVIRGIDGKISGILEAAGARYNVTWDRLANTDEVLSKLGYKTEDAETTVFFRILLNEHNETTVTTIFSNTSEADFERGSARIEGTRGADGHITWRVAESNLFNEVKVKIDGSNRLVVTLDTPGFIAGCTSTGDFTSGQIQLTDDIETTKRNIVNEIGGYTANAYCSHTEIPAGGLGIPTTTQSNITYSFSADTSGLIDEGEGSIFSNDGSEQTALQSLISLGRGFSTLRLSDDERYDLYNWYLGKAIPNLYSTDRIKCQDYENSADLKNGLQEIHLKRGDTWYVYYVNVSGVDLDTSKYNDIEPGAVFTTKSLREIIEWMNSHDAQEMSAQDCASSINSSWMPDSSSGVSNTTVVDAESSEVNCYNAAGALGWILCPVIDFTQHTINAIYGSIVENFLEFRAEWLDIGGQGESVYQAWQTFQSFANIIFVIVLLVVIFSQLTGVGIDNLGIKRVLPKLIIAAILINLSYLICMLFVDISNILGVGFNNIFSNIIVSIDGGSSAGTGAQVLTTVVTGAVAGAVGFLALNPVTVGIFGSVIVIPLVLGLIGVLVGVLFFFILLGARQAGIIMLVVASPIAFACYMLPNTKTIFDKWLKMFEGLLLLFPICGLLMGGSAFASKVLLTVDTGFLGTLIAMLVGVVPFFFIPTLLRGAFSAMGNIGARIAGAGQSLSRTLGGAVARSDTMKDAQTRMRAGVDRNGNLTWAGRRRGEIARGNSRLSRIPGMQRMARRINARSMAEYTKYQQEMSRQDRLNDPSYRERFERSQEMALEKEQFATEMDIVNDQTNKGNLSEKTYDIFNSALGEYNAASTDEDRKAASFKMKAAAEVAGGDSYKIKDFIKRIKEDSNDGKLTGGALEAVAKQISTGENARKYRATDALGFEYMSQITNGDAAVKNADGSYKTYEQWASDANNVHKAIENHVAESGDLVSQSTDSLSEIYRRVSSNGLVADKVDKNGNLVHIDDKQTIANLAHEAERNVSMGTGKHDVTKDSYIGTLKGMAPDTGVHNNDMRPGQSYSTHGVESGNASASNSSSNAPSPAPSRGNMNDEELRNLRNFYQRKVDNNAATPEDRNALNRINNELDLRETGYGGDEGTPV